MGEGVHRGGRHGSRAGARDRRQRRDEPDMRASMDAEKLADPSPDPERGCREQGDDENQDGAGRDADRAPAPVAGSGKDVVPVERCGGRRRQPVELTGECWIEFVHRWTSSSRRRIAAWAACNVAATVPSEIRSTVAIVA